MKTPLTLQELQDLATEAARFVRAMQQAHPREHTTATISTEGVSINFGPIRSVRLERGEYAYQSIENACIQLNALCRLEGWIPRFVLPECAKD